MSESERAAPPTSTDRSGRTLVVAIDGPAGAGKSTVARLVADSLGYTLVDTGAIYRAVAMMANERGVATDDEPGLVALARGLTITFGPGDGARVFVDGEDVSEAIRTPLVSELASQVSAVPGVRAALLDVQRRFAARGQCVMEGRDIGTVVCPDAAFKFFLDADFTVRAQRRYEELRTKGESIDFDELMDDLRRRDERDRNRAVAPLRPAPDAQQIDASHRSAPEVAREIVDVVLGRVR